MKALANRLLMIFVSPTEVFDEVITSPPNLANWRVPTLLVCLVATVVLITTNNPDPVGSFSESSQPGLLTPAQKDLFGSFWPMVSTLTVFGAAVIGSVWSAFVLWFISRFFLKVRVPPGKILEVIGLTSVILLLGTIVTPLLGAAVGNSNGRPALSLLAFGLRPESHLWRVLDSLNLFHLWTTAVLAIGLSRLAGVAFKEAAFWVFGYWVVARLALILLS